MMDIRVSAVPLAQDSATAVEGGGLVENGIPLQSSDRANFK